MSRGVDNDDYAAVVRPLTVGSGGRPSPGVRRNVVSGHLKFYTTHAKPIAVRGPATLDALIVHERAVGTVQINDLQHSLTGFQPAVQP